MKAIIYFDESLGETVKQDKAVALVSAFLDYQGVEVQWRAVPCRTVVENSFGLSRVFYVYFGNAHFSSPEALIRRFQNDGLLRI